MAEAHIASVLTLTCKRSASCGRVSHMSVISIHFLPFGAVFAEHDLTYSVSVIDLVAWKHKWCHDCVL